MLARGDGLWLQPEPLLYLGMTNGDPGRPRAYSGVYAGGNPVMWSDRSGRFVDIALDMASVGLGAYSFSANMRTGNYGGAIVDGAGVAVDTVMMAIPGATVGMGIWIAGGRKALSTGVDATTVALKTAPSPTAVSTGVDASRGSALQEASDAAFKAADDIGSWTPKNKHMEGGGSQSKSKFVGTEGARGPRRPTLFDRREQSSARTRRLKAPSR
jgi:hypothetical protein